MVRNNTKADCILAIETKYENLQSKPYAKDNKSSARL